MCFICLLDLFWWTILVSHMTAVAHLVNSWIYKYNEEYENQWYTILIVIFSTLWFLIWQQYKLKVKVKQTCTPQVFRDVQV